MAEKEYIERGALLQYAKEYAPAFSAVFEIIALSVPAADVVEVRHGRWVIKTDDYDCEYMMCSCCREEFYPVDEDTVDTTPNYCPHCGAKMDGETQTDTDFPKDYSYGY